MADTVNITVLSQPVAVATVTSGGAVTLAVTAAPAAVVVDVVSTPQAATVAAVQEPQMVEVTVTEAEPGAPGETGPPGPPGAPAEIVVTTLAAYLALAPAVQMDGRWYVIPTTS